MGCGVGGTTASVTMTNSRIKARQKSLPKTKSVELTTTKRSGDITLVLSGIQQGDGHAAEQLLPLVYDELRKLAKAKMAAERPGQTLQPTGLVHEAYVRLVDVNNVQHWDNRGHFYSAAAEAMRRILIDRARHKETQRSGGDAERVPLDDVEPAGELPQIDLLALNDALMKLECTDPRKAELVKLRFFAGLTVRAAAATLGIALSTAHADWAYAKSWLQLEMTEKGHS